MDTRTFALFEHGMLAVEGIRTDINDIPWNRHKDFAGVYLKNIVTPEKTGGRFTCHLVRIEPGKKIGLHTHPTSIELHEVIDGRGFCQTEQERIAYAPGSVAILPDNMGHEVQAGEEGLCLFAKFITV